jgi:RNA polymerase sigma-70 factor (ECF subfamily)
MATHGKTLALLAPLLSHEETARRADGLAVLIEPNAPVGGTSLRLVGRNEKAVPVIVDNPPPGVYDGGAIFPALIGLQSGNPVVSDAAFRTTLLHRCLDRLRAGDGHAYDDLIDLAGERLRHLASRMLHGFPAVRRWEDTQDVLQNAHVRLLRDLRDKDKRPASVRDFFNLAASRIRSVLLNLHQQHARHRASPGDDAAADQPDPNTAELDRWTAFHEAVERLDPTEREVVGLRFYHGWTQAEIAALLQVSDRMVRKHWVSACMHLRDVLGDALPDT